MPFSNPRSVLPNPRTFLARFVPSVYGALGLVILLPYDLSVVLNIILGVSMETLRYLPQLAPLRAAGIRGRGACHLWFPRASSTEKQLSGSNIAAVCASHSPYLSSCQWNLTQCCKRPRIYQTRAGNRHGSTWRSGYGGGEGGQKTKSDLEDRVGGAHAVTIPSQRGAASDTQGAAGEARTAGSDVAASVDEKRRLGTSQVERAPDRDAGQNSLSPDASVHGKIIAGLPAGEVVPEKGEVMGEQVDAFPKEQQFHIEVETTPNPLARKFFVHGVSLLPPDAHGLTSKSFSRRDKYDRIPLIKSLFEIPYFTSILVAKEYITVVKDKAGAWDNLEREVRICLLRHLRAGSLPLPDECLEAPGPSASSLDGQETAPLREKAEASAGPGASQGGPESVSNSKEGEATSVAGGDTARAKASSTSDEDDEEVVEAIKSLLYTRARPMLLADGGDLEMIRFDADTGVVWVYLKGSCQGCPSSLITVKRGMKQMLQYYIPEVEDVRQCDENGDPLEEEDEE